MPSRHKGAYEDAKVDLGVGVEQPSYQMCLDWMTELPDARAATLDFWSRGNFVRRLLYNRSTTVHPVLVPARNAEEMRWVYRRLALAGVPVDLIYTGPLSRPQWIKHWQPLDTTIDSGWGYIAFPGTVVRSESGRRWWPIMGYASLMPESVGEWLAHDANRPFAAGRVFVAPAALIGLSHEPRRRQMNALADVTNGTAAMESINAALAMLDFELPSIDGMTSEDFENLLLGHQDELLEFQGCFRELVTGYHISLDHANEARRRVCDAVSSLMHSARHEQLRVLIAKCRAKLTTFPMAMGLLAAAGAAYSLDPFAGAAVVAAAGKVMRDLWIQAKREGRASARGPLRLLLRLGVDHAVFAGAEPPNATERLVESKPSVPGPYHWLCPPSCGLRAAVAKE